MSFLFKLCIGNDAMILCLHLISIFWRGGMQGWDTYIYINYFFFLLNQLLTIGLLLFSAPVL